MVPVRVQLSFCPRASYETKVIKIETEWKQKKRVFSVLCLKENKLAKHGWASLV